MFEGLSFSILYLTSLLLFLLSAGLLCYCFIFERRRSKLGFAYPTPGLLFISCVFMFFSFSGAVLWTFEPLGRDFRVRFGYGYEYYLPAMLAGLLTMIFSYIGFSQCYYREPKHSYFRKFLNRSHSIITQSSLSIWLALAIYVIGTIFTVFSGDLASVGYGSGNYAQKISSFDVKLVGFIIDMTTPAVAIMWYLCWYTRKKSYFLLTASTVLGCMLVVKGRWSLFGLLGYVLPLVTLYFYSGLLPNRKGPIKPVSILSVSAVAGVALSFFIIIKTIYRINVNLGGDLDPIQLLGTLGSEAITGGVHDFLKEISGVDIVSLVLQRQEAEGITPQYGQTYALIPVSILPSLIFAQKPEVTLATWFANNYWFTPAELLLYGEGVQANIFHTIGELFINFNFAAFFFIPIVMTLYGCCLGLFARQILRPRIFYLPAYLILTRVMHEVVMTVTTLAAVFSAVVKQVIIVTVFIMIFRFCLVVLRMLFAPAAPRGKAYAGPRQLQLTRMDQIAPESAI